MQITIDTKTDTPATLRVWMLALLDGLGAPAKVAAQVEVPAPSSTEPEFVEVPLTVPANVAEAFAADSAGAVQALFDGAVKIERHYLNGVLQPEDQPDVGAFMPPPPPPADSLAVVFGGASAAVVTPPPPPAAVDAVKLDKNGLPWDARIHASSKALVADGTWRQKRGVDPVLLQTITAQLMAAVAAPAAPPPVPAAAFPPPPPAVTPPPAPPAAPPGAGTFGELLLFVTKHQTAGTLAKTQITAVCESVGVPSTAVLSSRPDLVPVVFEKLRVLVGAQG